MPQRSYAARRHRRGNLSLWTRSKLTFSDAWDSAARYLAAAQTWLIRLPGAKSLVQLLAGITPLGWAALVSGALMLIMGLRYSWMEAASGGTLLLVTTILAVLWSIGRSGYQIELNLERLRVPVGEQVLGELAISNPTPRTLASTRVEVPVGSGVAEFIVQRMASGESLVEPFAISTSRRGVITVGPAQSIRGDALGLVRRHQTWSQSVDLYIHPNSIPMTSTVVGFIRDIEGASTQDLSSSDVAFHALREYTPGDDRRNIHWKTTARVGELMVRQFEETRRSHMLVVFDLDNEAWAGDLEFETGVSAVATLVRAMKTDAKEASIASQRGHLPTATVTHAFDALSLIQRVEAAEHLPELTQKAGNDFAQASTAIVVTGSNTSISAIHAALARLPLNITVMAMRIESGAAMSMRSIGGYSIATISALEDVPLALRKALG